MKKNENDRKSFVKRDTNETKITVNVNLDGEGLNNIDTGLPFFDHMIEQLSMTIVNPMTAFLMLTEFVDLQKGQWIIQSASNSAVGGYIIQLAKQRGIKTINVVRRPGLEKDLLAKGADVVLIFVLFSKMKNMKLVMILSLFGIWVTE